MLLKCEVRGELVCATLLPHTHSSYRKEDETDKEDGADNGCHVIHLHKVKVAHKGTHHCQQAFQQRYHVSDKGGRQTAGPRGLLVAYM